MNLTGKKCYILAQDDLKEWLKSKLLADGVKVVDTLRSTTDYVIVSRQPDAQENYDVSLKACKWGTEMLPLAEVALPYLDLNIKPVWFCDPPDLFDTVHTAGIYMVDDGGYDLAYDLLEDAVENMGMYPVPRMRYGVQVILMPMHITENNQEIIEHILECSLETNAFVIREDIVYKRFKNGYEVKPPLELVEGTEEVSEEPKTEQEAF